MRASKFLRMLGVVFALALTAAACGDDDSGGDDVASDDSDVSDSGADDGDSEPDTGDGADVDLGDVFSGDCREAILAFSTVQSSFAGSFGGAFGQDTIDDAGDAIDELASAAPDEIKDAFQVYADELGAYFDALGDIDLSELAGGQPDPATIAALTAAGEAVDEEALEAAADEISTYFENACDG